MNAFCALTATQWMIFGRNPRTLFWNLAFPLLLLLIAKTSLQSSASLDERLGALAFSLNSGVFTLGLFGLTWNLAHQKELKLLDRLEVAPVSKALLLLAQAAAFLGLQLAQLALILLLGLPLLGLHLAPPILLRFGAASLLGGMVGISLGFGLIALIRQPQALLAASRLFMVLLFFLEGTFVAPKLWPSWLHTLSTWTPIRLELRLLLTSLGASSFTLPHLIALVGELVALSTLGLVFFPW